MRGEHRLRRRGFIGRVASYAGGVSALAASGEIVLPTAASAQEPEDWPAAPEVITARSLGARGDGTGDDGAILSAAIEARLGTLAERQSSTPLLIDFGDGRNVYNLASPIFVRQNLVQLVGDGAILQCSGKHAIVGDHGASPNILFGFHVSGFTLKGTIGEDAIVIRSGSQCRVEHIRNYARVGRAVVHYSGLTTCYTHAVASDGEFGGSCRHVLLETAYEKTPGAFFNCIANIHTELVAFACTGAGVYLVESDAFHISGDIENCAGPGVDLLNCRFGTVAVYTEVNGQGATHTEADPPDDIRIRSAPGDIVSRSSNIAVIGCSCAGQAVGGASPNNVHLLGADECLVASNAFGGNIRIAPGSARNHIGVQTRFIGELADAGTDTIALLTNFAGNGFVSTGPIGYRAGAGGRVEQADRKTGAVALDRVVGEIVTAASPLPAGVEALFTFNNSVIGPDDEISVWRKSGGRPGAYTVRIDGVSASSCIIAIGNRTSDTLAEAITIGFSVKKGAVT